MQASVHRAAVAEKLFCSDPDEDAERNEYRQTDLKFSFVQYELHTRTSHFFMNATRLTHVNIHLPTWHHFFYVSLGDLVSVIFFLLLHLSSFLLSHLPPFLNKISSHLAWPDCLFHLT